MALITFSLLVALAGQASVTPTTAPGLQPRLHESETSTAVKTSSVSPQPVATSTAGALVPPSPLGPTRIAYPSGAPAHETPVEVRVLMRVDEVGAVVRAQLLRGAGPPFDEAVLVGVTHFRFAPARYGGQPVAVDVNFTQSFMPPAPPPPPPDPEDPSAPVVISELAGLLRERGTRKPVAYANIRASSAGATYTATTAADGRFVLPLPAGDVRLQIDGFGYHSFVQQETLAADQRLSVIYVLQRKTYQPYEVVVVGKVDRTEVAKTTLRGREVRQIAGTFGDPFRVIQTLPGVSQMMSLLPFPIVRGSSPGNTGFLIDGVRVPLLFHLLAGPSVVHPEFIEEIEFYPGAFSADFGGYTGGIVNGRTKRARSEERRLDVDVNLFQAGAFVRYPVEAIGVTGTLAARVGYPGLLLSLASQEIGLSYWDYQARIDGGDRNSGWTLFAFGAQDALSETDEVTGEDSPILTFHFHRVDLRYHHRGGQLAGQYQLTLGFDESASGDAAALRSLSAIPRLRWQVDLLDELELRAGLDGMFRSSEIELGAGDGDGPDLIGGDTDPSSELYSGGVVAEALWRPWDWLLVRPSVRADLYHDTNREQIGVDPRLLVRGRVYGEASEAIYVKGAVGLYHQPPRFAVPLPGLDQIAFEAGLLESIQSSVGVEVPIMSGLSVDVQGYFAFMDPIFFDLAVNPDQIDLAGGDRSQDGQIDNDDGDGLTGILEARTGRSYGLELMLRRTSRDGAYGWISYTFSRAERKRGDSWVAFDFDRTHILNLVAGIPLPRNWEIGLRAQVVSGRPITTTAGFGAGRTEPFVRFDVRIDKTAVWNNWLLDFYVDISNLVLSAEELDSTTEIRYVLPTVGFRVLF